MIVKSSETKWLELSQQWYWGGGAAQPSINSLYAAFEAAQAAVILVAKHREIGSLTLPITKAQLESHNEKRRKIVSFCNAIHYEASKLVDNPFSVKMSETAQKAYGLDPSDTKVKTGSFLGIDLTSSLTKLISSTYTDDKLKEDFKKKYKALDKDEPSSDLKEAMKAARFWDKEYEKAENCKKIAEEIFTDEVRKNWPNMTVEERQTIVNDYANRIGQELYGEGNWFEKLFGIQPSVVKANQIDYTTYVGPEDSFGSSSYGEREIKVNNFFISNPTRNFSVDKVIDTVTHETRHEYQAQVFHNPEKYGAPEDLVKNWDKATYIPARKNYTKYYLQPIEADAKSFAALSRPNQIGTEEKK